MRSKTERIEGLGENVQLVEFNSNQIKFFLKNYSSFKREEFKEDISPSEIIIDNLSPWFFETCEDVERSRLPDILQ